MDSSFILEASYLFRVMFIFFEKKHITTPPTGTFIEGKTCGRCCGWYFFAGEGGGVELGMWNTAWEIEEEDGSGQMEYYFTNLDFPEIAGDFPYNSPPFGGPGRVRSL